MAAPIHKNRTTTMGRISGYISKTNIFRSVNPSSRLYEESEPLTSITHFPILGPHGSWKEWPFERVVTEGVFVPTEIGAQFGPLFTTHWFKIEIDVPDTWAGKEVHLRWESGSEACVWDTEGNVLQGISPGGIRPEYVISHSWTIGTGRLTYYIEMAANGMFGFGDDQENSEIDPPDMNKMYTLSNVDIAVFNRSIFKLYTDIDVLHSIASELANEHKGYQAMFAANEMINLMRRNKNEEAGQIADAFFAQGNGVKAHRLMAMGNCHIDTAWLWPYDETIRKCARSFAAQIGLMKEYPEYIFVCSQAQQFAWVKEYYPKLFDQIKIYVELGQFIPVGGCWVEMDGNMPSGEGFMRQYFYGQQFFRREFGITCREFWLPDTFGYSAQIPQMIKHIGINRFLTQKMSWSLVNKFPNHNFIWEGIDGTQVLVHFPPGDTYNMRVTAEELVRSEKNSLDKGRSNVGIYLVGFGDGGGGPTRTMLERLRRYKDVDGIPRVEMATPDTFFERLSQEQSKFYKWTGELYLELHNATYTSQARIKWYNRKCEFLFREVELLMCMAYVSGKLDEPQLVIDMATIDKNWQAFLTNQFHDVLPGSCIELVAIDAWQIYASVFEAMITLRSSYDTLMLNTGANKAIFNPLPWAVRSVVFMKPDAQPLPTGPNIQAVTLDAADFEEQGQGRYRVPNNFAAALVVLKGSGYSAFNPIQPTVPVTYSTSAGLANYNNGKIRLEVAMTGRPVEKLYYTTTGGEVAVYNDRLGTGTEPGMLYMYDDVPLFWDAWDVMDYHLETRHEPDFITEGNFEHIAGGPIVGCYKWTFTFGDQDNPSTLTRYTIMRAESPMIEYYLIVDWKESHKFLKVEFPVDVLSREATYEIQYGHVKRPTHINTTWDMAKFEVCGHKWIDISQADKGVTLITDSKYGWHVRDNIVKLSLVRAPKNPDANCDIHKHFIYYAVLPHQGTFQQADVIRRSYELNVLGANNIPLLATDLAGANIPADWVTTSNESIIVEACKVAAEERRKICIRLYESFGGENATTVSLGFPVASVEECNGLEDVIGPVPTVGNTFTANFKPFQIRSFLIRF